MKFALAASAVVLLVATSFQRANAVLITQEFDPTIYQESSIVKPVTKIIFSKVERQQVLEVDDKKYTQEFAYFFSKFGFKRPPVAYLLFDNGTVASLNNDWSTNQFKNNLDTGAIFSLLVYKGAFDINAFKPALGEFKNSVLKKSLNATGLKNVDDIQLRSFIIEGADGGSSISFKDPENADDIKQEFKDIDFSARQVANLSFEDLQVPANADPSSVQTVKASIKNNSDFDFVLNTANQLKFTFEKDSVYFINNKWLTPKTPAVLSEGVIKAGTTSSFQFDIRIPVSAGKISETVTVSLNDKKIDAKPLATTVADKGQKVLRIKPTELNYLNVRKEASASSAEIGRASVGSLYVYSDFQNNFYKIEYNGQPGWVSGKYVELITK